MIQSKRSYLFFSLRCLYLRPEGAGHFRSDMIGPRILGSHVRTGEVVGSNRVKAIRLAKLYLVDPRSPQSHSFSGPSIVSAMYIEYAPVPSYHKMKLIL